MKLNYYISFAKSFLSTITTPSYIIINTSLLYCPTML